MQVSVEIGLYSRLYCFNNKRFGKCTPSPKIVMSCTHITCRQTPFSGNGTIDLNCSGLINIVFVFMCFNG